MFYFLGFKVGHFNEIYILKSVDDIYTVYAIIEMRKIERKKKDDGARESLPLSLMLFRASPISSLNKLLNEKIESINKMEAPIDS